MNLDEQTQAIEHATAAELLTYIGKLETEKARAFAAYVRLTQSSTPATQPEPDEWISAELAAPRLGLTVTQLKRRRDLPFRKKHGPRTVRYSTRGIERYLRTRAA